ncbi:MAG: hypothetical protein D6767_03860, partial [Candidatus Hydrogenedentota bacterium]
YTPAIAEKTVEKILQSKKTTLCTLCERRISYKHKQFETLLIAEPYLLLKHNPFLSEHDRFYQDPMVNSLFTKMCHTVWGKNPKEFLVREVLRCHFGAEDVSNPAWIENCKTHIEADISQYKLKGIVLFGKAARILFPDNKVRSKYVGKVFSFCGLPTVLSPGADTIIDLQNAKAPPEKIKQVKKLAFDAMKLFEKEVMHAQQ